MKKLLYVALLALGVVIMMTPPAMAQEEKPFTLHGEVRFRGEYDANASDLNKDTDDQGGFWPYRVRIAAEGHFSRNISTWIEFQNAGVAGNVGASNISVLGITNPNQRVGSDFLGFSGSNAELYQGNITIDHLWWKNFSARLGRQEIVAGNELLLGDLDFYAGLTHDGMVGNFKLKKGTIMLLYTRPVQGAIDTIGGGFLPPDQINFTGGGIGGFITTTTNFYGAYTNWDIPLGTLDLYALDLKSHGGGGVKFDVRTIGVRWARDLENKTGLFWDAEFATQNGDDLGGPGCGGAVTTCKAKGNAAEGWIGWNFKMGKNNHRIYARIERASGDDDATAGNGDEKGFIPLFGDFHNRMGHGDWFQLSGRPTNLTGGGFAGVPEPGIQATAVGWNGRFADKHEVGVEIWQYNSDKKDAPGGGLSPSDKIGNAWDAWYGYNYSKNLTFTAALSELSPDDFLKHNTVGGVCGASGCKDTVTRLYGNARIRF